MDWNSVLTTIINALLPVILTAFTAIAGLVGTKAKSFLEKKEFSFITKEVIEDTVQYVEQVYKDTKGEEKLNKVLESVQNQLQSKGIEVTADELKIKIEAAVYKLTNSYYEK
jgi:hypothetical protein